MSATFGFDVAVVEDANGYEVEVGDTFGAEVSDFDDAEVGNSGGAEVGDFVAAGVAELVGAEVNDPVAQNSVTLSAEMLVTLSARSR